MQNLITDFWYGDAMADCDGIDCFFRIVIVFTVATFTKTAGPLGTLRRARCRQYRPRGSRLTESSREA